MDKSTSRLIPSHSYPYGAAAAASMASSDDFPEGGGKVCLIILLVIISIVLTIFTPWEYPLVFWSITLTLIFEFWWRTHKAKNKYACDHCGYLKCAERGTKRSLLFCNKWTPKPIQFFGLIIWTVFVILVTVIFMISDNFGARILTLIFNIPGLSIVLVLWIDKLKLTSIPHAYLSPPPHATFCSCGGTGRCPYCASRSSWSYRKPLPTSNYGEICSHCKGSMLCPKEVSKVAPELFQSNSDLIGYAFFLIIFGYVIGGLFLDYIYVYGGVL